jgi:hypothetical protein
MPYVALIALALVALWTAIVLILVRGPSLWLDALAMASAASLFTIGVRLRRRLRPAAEEGHDH